MALTTGTATDYHDLLDKLRLWLTGTAGWTQLAWTAPASLTDTATLWVRGPGAGPDRQVFVGIQSRNDTTQPAYGWAVRGAIGYDSGLGFGQQQGSSNEVFFNTWQNSIPYWFYANDRRFIVVAKVSTVYVPMYAGFMLPFALPSEYPFPLYIAGNYQSLKPADYTNSANRFLTDPGTGSAFYRRRTSSSWHPVWHHLASGSDTYLEEGNHTTRGFLWPMAVPRNNSNAGDDWSMHGFTWLRPNINGEMPIWQSHLIDFGSQVLAGALDGVFATPGFDRASEQVVTAGGRTFRLFQNIYRSTGRDFMAIEEI